MAQSVHLSLRIEGEDVAGDSTVTSLGRQQTIECLSLFYELSTQAEAGTTRQTGRRLHSPVTITKRIDRSSPRLYQALAMNENVDLAEFRFYRPTPSGDGTEEHFFSIHLGTGRVSAVRLEQLSTVSPEYANYPELERVSFSFQEIAWTYMPTGATHTDSVLAQR